MSEVPLYAARESGASVPGVVGLQGGGGRREGSFIANNSLRRRASTAWNACVSLLQGYLAHEKPRPPRILQ